MVGSNEGGEIDLGAQGAITEYRQPHLDPIREKARFVQLATRVKYCAALTLSHKALSGDR